MASEVDPPVSGAPEDIPLESALDIAAAVRAGARTAVDVAREHLGRIAVQDRALNAFQHVRERDALADAAAVDARADRATLPLAGVPVVVKDNMSVAGLPLRHGSAATGAGPAPRDDEIVRRLRAAGAVVLGTTRMPELAIWGFTASRAFGATRNPLAPDRDPGGSTGGGAAAVAAGLAALAVGTDGGGSIRIPSAYCGLVGLKPGRGVVPLPGGVDDHWFGLTAAGPLAHHAADAAAAFAVLSGRDWPGHLPDVPPLRIAWSHRSPSPTARADRHQRTAVNRAVSRLAALGHTTVPAAPSYPVTLVPRWTTSWLAGVAREAEQLGLSEAALEPRTRRMVRTGRRILALGGPWQGFADRWAARAERFLTEHDVVLSPVVARGPGPAGALAGAGFARTFLSQSRTVAWTQPWNVAGFPAAVAPVGTAGLPLAVQLVGRPGSEMQLLALADQLAP